MAGLRKIFNALKAQICSSSGLKVDISHNEPSLSSLIKTLAENWGSCFETINTSHLWFFIICLCRKSDLPYKINIESSRFYSEKLASLISLRLSELDGKVAPNHSNSFVFHFESLYLSFPVDGFRPCSLQSFISHVARLFQ